MRRFGIVTLAPQCLSEPEVGEFQPRLGKISRPAAVRYYLFVGMHGPHPFTGVLEQVRLFQAEKIVSRILLLQAAHHLNGFFVFPFATQKKRDHGAGFHVGRRPSLRIVPQHLHAF